MGKSITTVDWAVFVWDAARNAATIGHRMMMCDPFRRVYLWCRETVGAVSGEIVAAADSPSPAHLIATAQPMPASLTADQLTRWIHDAIRPLPFLPLGD